MTVVGRRLVVGALVSLLAAGAVEARPHKHHAVAAPANGSSDAYYTNVSGHQVHRPVHASSRPAGASAQCGDGSYSFSEHHRGTCSHHGGVARWY
jgi:hypothetical protein